MLQKIVYFASKAGLPTNLEFVAATLAIRLQSEGRHAPYAK